ncbi:MAG: hypothetical protein GY797_18535 [Deltaproteobacteria bacterium]|nr:hypothetical protein [Deltaproteobacteria bacterium]
MEKSISLLKQRIGRTCNPAFYFLTLVLIGTIFLGLGTQGCTMSNSKSTLDYRNDTPIKKAAWGGKIDTVQALLDEGADVNAKGDSGVSVLRVATMCGRLDVVKLLIDNGADVNAKGDSGITALMEASRPFKRLDVVKFLIDSGADVDAEDNVGKTTLMHASDSGHLDVVKFLIDNGADVDAKDNSGQTALMIASDTGDCNVALALLEKGADVDAKDNVGKTTLMHASDSGQLYFAEFLIDNGADVDAKDDRGQTALMHASDTGDLSVVLALLDNGADVNAKDDAGETALMIAYKKKEEDERVALVLLCSTKEHQPYLVNGSASIVGTMPEKWDNGRVYLYPDTNCVYYWLSNTDVIESLLYYVNVYDNKCRRRCGKLIRESSVSGGSFSFSDLPPGKYTLKCKVGFNGDRERALRRSLDVFDSLASGSPLTVNLGEGNIGQRDSSGKWSINGKPVFHEKTFTKRGVVLADGEKLKVVIK